MHSPSTDPSVNPFVPLKPVLVGNRSKGDTGGRRTVGPRSTPNGRKGSHRAFIEVRVCRLKGTTGTNRRSKLKEIFRLDPSSGNRKVARRTRLHDLLRPGEYAGLELFSGLSRSEDHSRQSSRPSYYLVGQSTVPSRANYKFRKPG